MEYRLSNRSNNCSPIYFYSIGQGALAGASVLGLGALAYYGLGMSKEVGAVERSIMWPEHVKQRIRNTYCKFTNWIVLKDGQMQAQRIWCAVFLTSSSLINEKDHNFLVYFFKSECHSTFREHPIYI